MRGLIVDNNVPDDFSHTGKEQIRLQLIIAEGEAKVSRVGCIFRWIPTFNKAITNGIF